MLGFITPEAAFQHLWFLPAAILEPLPTGQRARDYLNLYVKPTLLAGLTALCKEKPADPMVGAGPSSAGSSGLPSLAVSNSLFIAELLCCWGAVLWTDEVL